MTHFPKNCGREGRHTSPSYQNELLFLLPANTFKDPLVSPEEVTRTHPTCSGHPAQDPGWDGAGQGGHRPEQLEREGQGLHGEVASRRLHSLSSLLLSHGRHLCGRCGCPSVPGSRGREGTRYRDSDVNTDPLQGKEQKQQNLGTVNASQEGAVGASPSTRAPEM